jgi:hypothetical protein
MGSPIQHSAQRGKRTRCGARATIDDCPAALSSLDIRLAIASGTSRWNFTASSWVSDAAGFRPSKGLT